MNTIQQTIEYIARIYNEQNQSMLNSGDQGVANREAALARTPTEKDFLASIARDKAVTSCDPDFRCAFQELEYYRASPDAFIDRYVGQPGSTARLLYERQAKDMLGVALRYLSSQDDDRTDHPFNKEMEAIEARYTQCTLTRGIVEMLSLFPAVFPAGQYERDSFAASLDACIAPRKKTPACIGEPHIGSCP